MTNENKDDVNDSGQGDDDLDLAALADSLFADEKSGNSDNDSKSENQDKEQEEEGSDDEKKSDGDSNESAADAEPKITMAEAQALFKNWQDQQASEVDNKAKLKEITDLLSSGDPESLQKVGELTRAAVQQEQLRSQYGSQAVSQYGQEILDKILPVDFVESLTDEEAEEINPEKFKTDGEFFDAVINFRAKKLSSQTEEERINQLVEERLAERQNTDRANNMRSGSMTGAAAAEGASEPGAGLRGEQELAAIWGEASKVLDGTEN